MEMELSCINVNHHPPLIDHHGTARLLQWKRVCSGNSSVCLMFQSKHPGMQRHIAMASSFRRDLFEGEHGLCVDLVSPTGIISNGRQHLWVCFNDYMNA